MAKSMAWALAVLFLAAAALPAVDAASAGGGTLDQILKAGGERDATILIYVCCGVGVLFSFYLWARLQSIKVERPEGNCIASVASFAELENCYKTIQVGAKAFLKAEYTVCTAFVLVFGVLVIILTSRVPNLGDDAEANPYIWKWKVGALTMASFFVGAFTSMAAGYIGMMVAVMANGKCTVAALEDGAPGWTACFNVAFRAGAIMGFSNCGIAIIVLYGLCQIYRDVFTTEEFGERRIDYTLLFECVSGFGLGGSAIALFGRVGGGIFTKAADVGADLSGKVIGLGDGKMLDEDSPYNPAVIADNVGDNVGDVAGMGSDLFGSLGEASCAAMLLGSAIPQIAETGWSALMYPLYISAVGIVVCLVLHFVATDIMPVRKEEDIETVLKIQLFGTALGMTAALYPVSVGFLPDVMLITGVDRVVTPQNVYGCCVFGVWAGTIIGFITEYFTSHTYEPTREVARSCETGAATGIIYGIALGYLSSIVPVGLIAGAVYFCFKTTGLYGVAIGSLGMLSTLATCLTIDVYGPIADNAGGVAEMAEFPSSVRDKTDALDAAGNTTAAIGKGFAIGSAALVSVALTGAFVVRVSVAQKDEFKLITNGVNVMSAVVFTFIIFGANIPYWFSALTMKSVGQAANAMVREVGRQWAEIPGLRETASMDFDERAEKVAKGQTLVKPDYTACISIATQASLTEMIAPAALVLLSPILVGAIFGVEAVVGLLVGSMSSSVQLAISMSNTGGAWDNSKKFCEKGGLNGWFMFRDGKSSMSEEDFKTAARTNNGDECLAVPSGRSTAGAGPRYVAPSPVNSYNPYNPYGMAPMHGQSPMMGMPPGMMGMYPMGGQMVMGSAMGVGAPASQMSFKQWLGELSKSDPARYKKIMQGEEGVPTVDGRVCIYAGKKSTIHAACVVGDTVGDPFKDTSGPALNIVMKLMAILSVVFADFFMSINHGNGAAKSGELRW
eukprot:Tamp_02567.p1 GENE.Tamp_02567~~Tamp_02567.p1  ORF type:complete len:958 (-),score=237.61 Tamp_02567:1210-4083(-)